MPDASNVSCFMTVKEVSQHLRLTERTIYTMLENGVIPGVQIGRVWRIDREQLDQKLRGQK